MHVNYRYACNCIVNISTMLVAEINFVMSIEIFTTCYKCHVIITENTVTDHEFVYVHDHACLKNIMLLSHA